MERPAVSERQRVEPALRLHGAQRLPEQQPRALIADADRPTRLLIARHLCSEGFATFECGDGRDALEQITASRFDLIVLDGGLSGLDGIALCRAIRQGPANSRSAILIIATSSAESDKVLALVNGADDYLTKPLSIREFLARVSAVLRRTQPPVDDNAKEPIARSDIRLDPSKRQVRVRGSVVACSKQEFDLLYALASSPGIVFRRDELVARYWRGGPDAEIRLVDPIISRLRRKIERNPDAPRMILTVWGVGYKFSESEI
jgi:two-component system OmpR family response regulator/two-component system alkaline phosphatase synthesis response regulator PhoP